jgi:hypothetical protein
LEEEGSPIAGTSCGKKQKEEQNIYEKLDHY